MKEINNTITLTLIQKPNMWFMPDIVMRMVWLRAKYSLKLSRRSDVTAPSFQHLLEGDSKVSCLLFCFIMASPPQAGEMPEGVSPTESRRGRDIPGPRLLINALQDPPGGQEMPEGAARRNLGGDEALKARFRVDAASRGGVVCTPVHRTGPVGSKKPVFEHTLPPKWTGMPIYRA